MRAVVQCVSKASVSVEGGEPRRIGRGYVVLLGVGQGDTEAEAERLWEKVRKMRVFEDEAGKTNLALADVGGEVLVVSQFTLQASTRRGNRPSFTAAARPEEAMPLYETFVERLGTEIGRKVPTGRFGADMQVSLVNDGPVTIVIDSRLKE